MNESKTVTLHLHIAWASCLLGLLIVTPILAQTDVTSDDIGQRSLMQSQLSELERDLGRHDPALIESLVSLAEANADLNLFSEASVLIDRAIQIQRLNFGLYSDRQIPLYFEKIRFDSRRGDWQGANDSLDHVSWLLTEKQVGTLESLVSNLMQMTELHLRAVAADDSAMQAEHYRSAAEATFMALEISSRLWGERDPRRAELYYSLLKQFYLQSLAVEMRDETAYALRAIVPGSSWVRPRRVVQTRYFRAGLRLLAEMEDIVVANSTVPRETAAMVAIYRADWQLLFNRDESEKSYADAFTALQDLTDDASKVNRLFARPQILPIGEFYNTVDAALAAQVRSTASLAASEVKNAESGEYYRFQEWFGELPLIAFPNFAPSLGILSAPEYSDVLLSFNLDSMNTVSRWVSGRYTTRRSVVDEFQVIADSAEMDIDTNYLEERLHALNFRPRLVDGAVEPAAGTLLYRATID